MPVDVFVETLVVVILYGKIVDPQDANTKNISERQG
jgi:hypothetical protein